MYEATVTKVFSAAHAIRLPDGTTESLHGHDWRVKLTVTVENLNEVGMVMDFHELEQRVDAAIDQARNGNLNGIKPFANGQTNPTAEHVAQWIGAQVIGRLPKEVSLDRVSVREAPGCVATYRP